MIEANIKYINSQGKVLDLSGFPIKLQVEDLFDYEWSVDTVAVNNTSSNVTRFKRHLKDATVKAWFYASTQEDVAALINYFFETTEYDVVTKQPGRLVVNDGAYMVCFITSGENRKWQKQPSFNERMIKFTFPHPFWIDEQTQAYQPSASKRDIDEGKTLHLLGYPYQYRYGYDVEVIEGSGDDGSAIRSWEFAGIAEAPFVLEIYGAVANPRVTIDGHLYQVNVTLQEDDKVVIDSRDNTVTLYRYASQGGNVINAYSYQNFDSNVFQPIPCGRAIQASSVSRFKLTVYAERSEPQWS